MRVLLFITAATLALSTTAFAQSLSGDQIRETLVGNTMSGFDDGEVFHEYLNPNGTISGSTPSGRYSGQWRISGDEICFAYDTNAKSGPKWDCSEVRLRRNRIIWDDNSTATLIRRTQ